MPRRRLHPVWLFLVIVALVSWSGNARFMKPPPEREASAGTPASANRNKSQQPQKETPVSSMTAVMVPVYTLGSLLVEAPKKNLPKQKKEPSQNLEQTAKRSVTLPSGGLKAINAALSLDGERPALSVSYDAIGFERYLTISEQRIGRMFALVADGNGGMTVGSEISLLRDEVKPKKKAVLARLATKRPHIVNDPEIRPRLARLSLPEGAQPDRAVFYFYSWFDQVLWRSIATTLSRLGHQFKDIASIQGRYRTKGSGIYLELATAIHKDGRKLNLGKKIWVTL